MIKSCSKDLIQWGENRCYLPWQRQTWPTRQNCNRKCVLCTWLQSLLLQAAHAHSKNLAWRGGAAEGGGSRQELHPTHGPRGSNLAHKSKEQPVAFVSFSSGDGKNPELKRHFYIYYQSVSSQISPKLLTRTCKSIPSESLCTGTKVWPWSVHTLSIHTALVGPIGAFIKICTFGAKEWRPVAEQFACLTFN